MDLSKLPKLSQTPPAGRSGDGQEESVNAGPAGPDAVASAFCPNCAAALAPGSRFCNACGARLGVADDLRPGIGVEAWISIVIGVMFLALGWRFGQYLSATIRGAEFHTRTLWVSGEKAGQEVADYWELVGHAVLSDSALFLFGVAMILEGIVLLVAFSGLRFRLPLVRVALAVAVGATLYNGYAVAVMISGGVPAWSLLAVAIGVYIIAWEWKLLGWLRRA